MIEFETFAELEASKRKEGQRVICRERGNAEYIVDDGTPEAGDATFANGLRGLLQPTDTGYSTTQAGVATDVQMQELLNRGSVVIDSQISATKAGFESLPNFGIMPPANTDIRFKTGCFVTLEGGVDVRHIFAHSGSASSNVNFYNPQIDGGNSTCNGIGGANGASSRLDGVHIHGGHFKNIKHNFNPGSLGGGRGVTFQFGVSNCSVTGGTHFENVSEPCDVAGTGNVVTHGTQDAYGIVYSNYTCVDCDTLGGSFNLTTQSSQPESFTAAIFSNISFRNCGASDLSWDGLSFVRINNAGNSDPFGDVYRDGTTYNGNWEPETYSSGDDEWDADTASYSIGARVKITNIGQLSALFAFQGDGGLTVTGVSGTNESSYPTIGAIVSGTYSGVDVDNVNINVSCNQIVNAGATGGVYPVNFRYYDKVIESRIKVRNIGGTGRVIYGSLPVNVANELQQEGLSVHAEIDSATLTEILNEGLGVANGGYRNSVAAVDVQQYRYVEGNFDFVYQAQNSLPSGGFSGNYNHITTVPKHIKVYQSNNQLRLERVGSNAGAVDLYATSIGLNIDTEVQLESAGDGYKAKSPNGTTYRLAAPDGGGAATWVIA